MNKKVGDLTSFHNLGMTYMELIFLQVAFLSYAKCYTVSLLKKRHTQKSMVCTIILKTKYKLFTFHLKHQHFFLDRI